MTFLLISQVNIIAQKINLAYIIFLHGYSSTFNYATTHVASDFFHGLMHGIILIRVWFDFHENDFSFFFHFYCFFTLFPFLINIPNPIMNEKLNEFSFHITYYSKLQIPKFVSFNIFIYLLLFFNLIFQTHFSFIFNFIVIIIIIIIIIYFIFYSFSFSLSYFPNFFSLSSFPYSLSLPQQSPLTPLPSHFSFPLSLFLSFPSPCPFPLWFHHLSLLMTNKFSGILFFFLWFLCLFFCFLFFFIYFMFWI